MSKHVDADALLEVLYDADAITPRGAKIIREFPEGVVRCKNCKHWDRERISCEGLAKCNTGEGGIRFRYRNDFCSIGARRDGDGE